MKETGVSYLPIWNRYLAKFEDAGLTNEDMGALLRAMMHYQFRDEEPTELSGVAKIFWMFLVEDLDRAKAQYVTSVNNGKKGGRPKKNAAAKVENQEKTQTNPEKGITRTESRTESKTESRTKTRERTKTSAREAEEDLSVCEKAYGEFGWVKLTDEQYAQLEKSMGQWELTQCITYIDRAAQTTNNRNQWRDWSLVLMRCHEEAWHHTRRRTAPVPTGASGQLGEAELEAIRRVLSEE